MIQSINNKNTSFLYLLTWRIHLDTIGRDELLGSQRDIHCLTSVVCSRIRIGPNEKSSVRDRNEHALFDGDVGSVAIWIVARRNENVLICIVCANDNNLSSRYVPLYKLAVIGRKRIKLDGSDNDVAHYLTRTRVKLDVVRYLE